MQAKVLIPTGFEQRCILLVFEPNFLTQLSPNVAEQQRNRQRREEEKNYKDRKNEQINRTLPEVQRR